MNKMLLTGICVFTLGSTLNAQPAEEGKPFPLGTTKEVLLNATQHTRTLSDKGRPGRTMKLALPDGNPVEVQINYQKSDHGAIYLEGKVLNSPDGNVRLSISERKLEGSIIMISTKKAYAYYSDAGGRAFVKEADINKFICVDLPEVPDPVKEEYTLNHPKSNTRADVSNLQSLPGSGGCLLLDFDGYYMPAGNGWNNGSAISAAASGMNSEQITEAWEIVSEDYRPFNLNVTTNEAVFNSYPQNKRQRCVITPTNYFAPGYGGIAYIGSFPWSNDYPCWTFTTGVGTGGKYVGEATSHELGHTMGLVHDGTATATYYSGYNNWAPVMGVSYYKPITQWSKGEYPGATNFQDDLAVISGSTNGIGYRASDHNNNIWAATPLIQSAGNISAAQNKGVIERNDDTDVFSFTTTGGNVALNVAAIARHTDLNLQITLYNNQQGIVGNYAAQPGNLSLPVLVNIYLPAGTYYLAITGIGYSSATQAVYTDYGSMGAYSISGTIAGMSGSKAAYHNVIVAIAAGGNLSSQKAYPNPVAEELNINTGAVNDDYQIEITNSAGQVVYKARTSEKVLSVSFSGKAAGIYFVRIKGTQSRSDNSFKVLKR